MDELLAQGWVAWDLTGDGRMALRASYALAYDFMAGDYHNINSSAPPFGNRSLITDPPGRMDDPYGRPSGGDPHPIVTDRNVAFPRSAPLAPWIPTSTPHASRTGTSRSSGTNWGAAVSYLGSYSDRLWAQTAINPGIYMVPARPTPT